MVPVAQLDRAPDYESGGWEFESLRARQKPKVYASFMSKKETGHLTAGFQDSVSFYDFYSQFSRYSEPLPLRKASE